jgi:hypothetical protein
MCLFEPHLAGHPRQDELVQEELQWPVLSRMLDLQDTAMTAQLVKIASSKQNV